MKGISQDALFEFFHGDRVNRVLEEVYELATNCEDANVRLRACKEILNRTMGKPADTMGLNVQEGYKPIIVGLKGDDREEIQGNS